MPPGNKWHFIVYLKNKVLHDIQRLDEERTEKGQDQGQVLEMSVDGKDQCSGGYKEQDPINTCILLLLFHWKKICANLREMG
jgi:hypothetical protein